MASQYYKGEGMPSYVSLIDVVCCIYYLPQSVCTPYLQPNLTGVIKI